jgi:hypothetical protein
LTGFFKIYFDPVNPEKSCLKSNQDLMPRQFKACQMANTCGIGQSHRGNPGKTVSMEFFVSVLVVNRFRYWENFFPESNIRYLT